MNCDGVRGLLSAYLDGELSPGDLLRVEQHLRHCHWCADEVDSLRQTVSLVSSLEEVEVPPMFHAQLHERLVALGPPVAGVRRISSAPSRHRSNLRWAVPAAAAAAVLAIGLTTYPRVAPPIPGPVAGSQVIPDTAGADPTGSKQVATLDNGPKGTDTPVTVPPDDTAPVNSSTEPPVVNPVDPGPGTDPAPLGTTPVNPDAPVVATGDSGNATPPENGTLTPRVNYTAELVAKGAGPEIVEALKAQYPQAVAQGNKLVISVPTDSFDTALKAVASILSIEPPAPVSQNLASQIKAAEDKLQASQTELKNFETEYSQYDEAGKAAAESTLNSYKQRVAWNTEALEKLNLSVKTSTITVQLQPAAR